MKRMGMTVDGGWTRELLGVGWVTGGVSQDARLRAELRFRQGSWCRSGDRWHTAMPEADFETLLCMPPWNRTLPPLRSLVLVDHFGGR